jgi:type II secretory pathway pseudopilin PulG
MRTLLIVVAVLAAAALPAVAIAAHAPSRSEKQELRAAVKASKLVQRSVRRGHFALVKPRISDSGKWAKAGIAPTNTYTDPFNAPKGIFKHRSSGWKLLKIGTTGIGCSKPKLPRSVRKELKLRCG